MLNKQWQWGTLLLMLPMVGQADISGRVFQDFNANGTYESGGSYNELPVVNVSVKAVASNGTTVATATTDAAGTYNLSGLSAATPYRIEFSWLDNQLYPSKSGGTSVQFAQDGSSNVNLALNYPSQYVNDSFFLSTPIAVVGPTNRATEGSIDYRTLGALVKFPSTVTGKKEDAGYIAPTVLATHQQIGSSFGIAYKRDTKQLFTSAYHRRGVGYGTGGTGGIYVVNPDDTVSLHAVIPNAGNDSHDFSGSINTLTYDLPALAGVGNISLGDMDISNDGQWLYVVNLNDRHLYKVATQTANVVNDLGAISKPASCLDADFRPFGLGINPQGTLYVGAVCSNQSGLEAGGVPKAHILRYDQVAGSFVEVMTFALNFSTEFWKSWSNTLDSDGNYVKDSAQPMLTDLAFENGNIIMALRSRTYDASYVYFGGVSGEGQVLKACGKEDTWTLETNGVCNGVTGTLPNYYNANFAGPGGGYFFDMRDYIDVSIGGGFINGMGSVALIPGHHIIATLNDSNYSISGGITRLNPTTGQATNPYEIFRGTPSGTKSSTNDPGYLGKSSGLGDIELVADPAPIEVGNRIWLDSNANGIQDANEAGLDGVEVVLQCGTDSATTSTSNGGQYYFSTASNAAIMQAGAACTIKVDTQQASLSTYLLTSANADGISTNDAFMDIRDSDASLNASSAEISFTVGQAGENNHSLDIGFHNPPKADLHLSKTAGVSSVQPGESFTYTLMLTNDGPNVATNVQVKDVLPSRMSYVSDTGGGTYNATAGLWQVGTVGVGAANAKTLKISVTAN
jgi:uncharacterized repeat protein (TIGR01451 family)